MSNSKIARIIQGVDKKTKAGEIDWETTEKEDVFQASLANYSIRLSFQEGELGNDYWFTIINNEGLVIESVSDVQLSGELEGAYRLMDELYSSSRRVALGVDEALDELLNIFDDDVI